MSALSRNTDNIQGMTSGEHSGHTSPHPPEIITGSIISKTIPNVTCNGLGVAVVGSITEEHDSCCGTSYGSVAVGSPNVTINGIPVARVGDSLNAHNGTANIIQGSPNVFVN